MLKYKFQDIKPSSGVKQTKEGEAVQFTQYPTGYPDFMISHLKIAKKDAPEEQGVFTHKFTSLSIAFVHSGSALVEVDGFTAQTAGSMKAYMILPERQVRIEGQQGEDLSIFFCSCDL